MGLETQFPIVNDGSGFNVFNTNLSFMPTRNFTFSTNYLVLNGNPAIDDSNQLTFQSYLRLNNKWGIGSIDIVELADGTLTQQEYTLHRDLGSWVMRMGAHLGGQPPADGIRRCFQPDPEGFSFGLLAFRD